MKKIQRPPTLAAAAAESIKEAVLEGQVFRWGHLDVWQGLLGQGNLVGVHVYAVDLVGEFSQVTDIGAKAASDIKDTLVPDVCVGADQVQAPVLAKAPDVAGVS